MGYYPSDMIRDYLLGEDGRGGHGNSEGLGWRVYEYDPTGKSHYAGWRDRLEDDEDEGDPFDGDEEWAERERWGYEYEDRNYVVNTPQYDERVLEYKMSIVGRARVNDWQAKAAEMGWNPDAEPSTTFYVARDGFFTDNIYEAAWYQDTKLGGM